MKKFLIAIVLFLSACQLSNAQTEKGTQTLGLNLGFSYNNSNNYTININDNNSVTTLDTKTTTFNIGPNYSYFIKNNLEIGGSLSYSTSNATNTAATTSANAAPNAGYATNQTSDNISASLFIRRYFMYKNIIGFRTGGYVGYSGGTNKDTYPSALASYNYNNTTTYYSGGANLDLVYFPSKKLGIAATLANLEYYHYNANNNSQGHDNGDNLTFSLVNNGLTLSVFYVFGPK
jgi:hypothetical protein